MSLVPYTFANNTGNIPLSQLDVNFANVKTFAYTAGYVSANAQANITSVGTLTSLAVSGTANVSGNVTGGNIITDGNVSVAGSITNGNITITGSNIISTGATLTIDPNGSGGTDGNVVITGNLTVQGTTTTIDSTTITTNDLQINMANNAATSTAANNGGIGVGPNGSEYATLLYKSASNSWNSNIPMSVTGNITGGNVIASGQISASANIAGANLSTAGNITGGNLTVSGTTSLVGTVTAPTPANGTINTQVATTAFVAYNGIPSGGIIMWSGSIASIPSGWQICDGTNSTPDLRDRFVLGAGSSYAVGATGGSADAVLVSHTHTANVTDPGHNHTVNGSFAVYTSGGSSGPNNTFGTLTNPTTTTSTTGISVTNSTEGVSGTNANLPPYYALAYIMKL